uniref:Glutathione S-transferase 2 n=1 Tax=Alexandrium pacificum TaxID=1565494 RepID=A0AA49K965_9DINO|nr:glutathione S-transferase 2 [Alexandrium pacificum]WLE99332.1 glutathione S-transferase 2 [Alexandrium pacificum]
MAPLTFHTAPGIPNPDVVHMYAEERGCQSMLADVVVNVGTGENRSPEFLKINPLGEVPALILPSGQALTESIAIVKYLDDAQGWSPLVGTTAEERALVDMWLLRCEQKVLEPIGCAFRNGPMAAFFKDRRPGYIHPEHAAGMRVAGATGLKWLDGMLADGRQYLCGDRFTLADIRFYCLYSFYTKMDKVQKAPDSLSHFNAYMDRIKARPSASAIVPKKSKL